MHHIKIVTNPNEMRKIYANLSIDAESNDFFCSRCGELYKAERPIDWPKYWDAGDRFQETHKECR